LKELWLTRPLQHHPEYPQQHPPAVHGWNVNVDRNPQGRYAVQADGVQNFTARSSPNGEVVVEFTPE